MNSNELQRIENDLATMRQVVKRDRPYSSGDILPLLVLGIGALACLLLLKFYALPKRASQRACLLFSLAPGILLYVRRYLNVQKNQAEPPVLRKEQRWSVVFAAIVVPAAIVWMWWGQRFGISGDSSAAAVCFCMGIGMSFVGVMDSARRYYLMTSIPLMILALSLPAIGSQHMPFAGTAFLAMICFTNAAFIWHRTRTTPGDGQHLCESNGPAA